MRTFEVEISELMIVMAGRVRDVPDELAGYERAAWRCLCQLQSAERELAKRLRALNALAEEGAYAKQWAAQELMEQEERVVESILALGKLKGAA